MEKLLQAGALDVTFTPLQMKKCRPGVKLSVLAKPTAVESLCGIIFTETTSIGVRLWPSARLILERYHKEVRTPWGLVRIKVGKLGSRLVTASPEYEDCRRLAQLHEVPLRKVYQAALNSWNRLQEIDRNEEFSQYVKQE